MAFIQEAEARVDSLTSAVIGPATLSDLVRALETTPRDNDAIVRALTPFCVPMPGSKLKKPNAVERGGSVATLVRMLGASREASVRTAAAAALARIAAHVPGCVSRAGAVQPLVAMLQTTDAEGTCKEAALALFYLAYDPPLRAPIAEAGAITPLVALLNSSTDASALCGAASALRNLARSYSLRVPIIEAGAIPPLASAMCSPDPTTRARAQHAIDALTSSAVGRAAVASNEQAVGALLRRAHHDAGTAGGDACMQAAKKLVRDDACCERALRSAGAQCARLAQEVDELRASHEQLLSQSALVSEPSAARHDVVFRCADGTQLGGSRALLIHGSSYFARQLGGGLAEGSRREVDADPDFSSAAHEALLRQLHAGGRAELPTELGEVLELLQLACKLQPPGEGAAGSAQGALLSGPDAAEAASARAGGDLLGLVAGRCEEAVLGVLDADNCLDILRHARAAGAGSRISEAARGVVKANFEAIVSQSELWSAFKNKDPLEACTLLEAVAADVVRAQSSEQGDDSTSKRLRTS